MEWNKNEGIDTRVRIWVRVTVRMQQMADKDATKRLTKMQRCNRWLTRCRQQTRNEKNHIKKGMEEMKRRGETVNDKFWSLETRMDSMSREQAESSCAIQSKLDALLRNSIAQEKTIPEKNREINRNKG